MRAIFAVLAGCLLLAAGGEPEAVKKDMARLQGQWSMVSGEIDTQALPATMLRPPRVIRMDDGDVRQAALPEAKFTIDPTKNPRL
jgi:hypothetical protein